MTKLLNQSFKIFLGYAAVVLACSIPAYYLIVDHIWQHELKEHNIIVSEGIRHNLQSLQFSDSALQESVQLWNQLQPEARLVPVASAQADSTYNVYRTNPYKKDKTANEDRFQGLVTCFELNGKPYSLTVETNMEESHETILGLTLVSIIFFIILLGGLIFLNKWLSARIWRPFYQSLDKIKNFDLHHYQAITFEPTPIAEFETLNNSLSQLIAGNIAAYQQQKHFIENASHELQTPLAIVQAKLDVFLQDATLSQKQSDSVEQAQNALLRVNRINKNLLLLAKIENRQFPDKEAIDLSELTTDNLEWMASFTEEKQLRVVPNIAPGIMLDANRTLTEILLSNLLMNAIKYSAHEGVITVALEPNSLRISNSGTEALEREQLFKRFGRTSAQSPATGLGLAIVAEVCKQYGWQILYDYNTGQHHFTVYFS